MKNPLLFIFGKIWPKSLYYYSTGTFTRFLKIRKKSKLDRNQFKLSTQDKNMYMYQEKI